MVGIGWAKEMKITKARLLQIIREEVELHEKYVEESVIELDEETLEELSKEAGIKAIEGEIDTDEEAGNLEQDSGVDEDRLFDPKTGKPVKPDDGTNQDDI